MEGRNMAKSQRRRWNSGKSGIHLPRVSSSETFRATHETNPPAAVSRKACAAHRRQPLVTGRAANFSAGWIQRRCARRGELKIAAARVGILERSRRRLRLRLRRRLRRRRRRLSGDPY